MKVGIIGANGYGGVELIRLLQQHPFVQLKYLASHSSSGKLISEQYPHLQGIIEDRIEELDINEAASKIELMFIATPSGISKDLIPALLEKGITCIDLSGDFRLKDGSIYEKWYKYAKASDEYLQNATYGLPEIFREEIIGSALIANPGCYPTATLLGLAPALTNGWISGKNIVIDGKSGVSGAGRKASLGTHYGEINENTKAYKLGSHQHIPEIEQIISHLSGTDHPITFSTHLVPMTRGILCTIYADLKIETTTEELLTQYEEYYQNNFFVRIRPLDIWPATKEVLGSNYCDIGIKVEERTNKLIIVSVIDNVVKGAAGQAVQNMNLLNGWAEETGLTFSPVYP
ncbi:N-acetyl-gamma-glutamyl-phosphate reductase [Bacillus tianshenii]|uniref:N-acetyl-gamma-glutamyl-phosphate reductase n=1 Tax=Sutcliffiella tianshenii TaxID=1463404 RepID=UPI001CD571A3|nr:N-acetyl-gamma-glutamyl-phosphate reductase [Bacillus tianshenii]MCA1319502.1 N-acetyl-gamma-glutamyl-phosphate reductase [Bacillus tianshenii]